MSRTTTRVLVVDDDEDIRTLVRMMLTLAGYAVVAESRDGAEAVRHAEALRPDVVILDLQMPLLGGEAAAVQIREASPSTRIVAFSANLTSLPSWADAWLSKTDLGRLPSLVEALGDSA